MRHESSTVVAVVGEVREPLLAELTRSPNVTLARPPGDEEDGLEAAAQALRKAAGSAAPYVLVPADPLAGVVSEWQAMWDVAQGERGAAPFEAKAREAVAAWRAGRFELPDYYLVLARANAEGSAPDAYLGPLRAARPRRVAVVPAGDAPGEAARVLDALRNLPHGPWWPPLDELIDSIRRFFAGGLAEGEGSGRVAEFPAGREPAGSRPAPPGLARS
jgi:hypothetical protein